MTPRERIIQDEQGIAFVGGSFAGSKFLDNSGDVLVTTSRIGEVVREVGFVVQFG